MENLPKFLNIPIEFLWVVFAVSGGVARYLNSYREGSPFKLGVFFASAFVAGFSGYMFALLGRSFHFTPEFQYMMAGLGGFMGEQTLKLLWEYTSGRISQRNYA